MRIIPARLMKVRLILGTALCLALAGLAPLPAPVAAATPDTLARPAGAILVPEKFLRRWDPITVFFDADTGPAGGGPEDNPGRFVAITPAQPGAYSWIDARTLQFRPADPWPALASFDVTVGQRHVTLATLLPAPLSVTPREDSGRSRISAATAGQSADDQSDDQDNDQNADQGSDDQSAADDASSPPPVTTARNRSSGLLQIDSIAIVLPDPVAPDTLSQMITLDLQPLPGLGAAARTLQAADFDLKLLERSTSDDPYTYILRPHEPIPGGIHVTMHLKLSPQAQFAGLTQDLEFATAEPFRITSFSCGNKQLPITPSGVTYPASSAAQCSSQDRTLAVMFSDVPAAIGPVDARNLMRITPPVDNLAYRQAGTILNVTGDFVPSTLYTVRLEPVTLHDVSGRPLDMSQPSQMAVYFPPQNPYLRWRSGEALLERMGPKMVPVEGRGFDRMDIRVYPVDPLNRAFWPFPEQPVSIDENVRPPGPGEEPPASETTTTGGARAVTDQIKDLGSPAISEIVTTPLVKGGAAERFGLDLEPYLDRLAGAGKPGTYLVGVRRLDAGGERSWMRVEVTDLSLTTVEEPDAVRFFVTSLATGQPVGNASVRIEGQARSGWVTVAQGSTDTAGRFDWPAPGANADSVNVRRVVVEKDGDTLVFDPSRPPPVGGAPDGVQVVGAPAHPPSGRGSGSWLQWALSATGNREEPERLLCHLFTERPIYRPEDPVEIKAWARDWKAGVYSPESGAAQLVVTDSDDHEWRYPVVFTPEGTAYLHFDAKTDSTGDYAVKLEVAGKDCGEADFKKQAYKLPTFEVQLHAADKVPLDRTFTVDLAARYYAGGNVAGRPVHWRVTQFAYDWQPEHMDGYAFSSDSRFSTLGDFQSTPVLEGDGQTDDSGNLKLAIDPTIEPTAQSRRYVVEATVTGPDDQTVTTAQPVLALPPFALGVKVPRFIDHATAIDPTIVAVGPTGALVAGQAITVRLLRREWNSALQAGDFSQGTAKYVTSVQDVPVSETRITSSDQPAQLHLPIDRAGVYLVELEAQDQTGRAQKLSVDLFANGDTPLAWAREPARTFAVSTDKPAYAPGDTADMVLQSPYQTGEALMVVERADGHNLYRWIEVKDGVAHAPLAIERQDMPSLPVHFVLMRGRVADPSPDRTATVDLAKPATVVNDTTLTVTPVAHQVNVAVTIPDEARPGDEIDVTVKLTDNNGNPLAGETTLWLVDQAVLALAKEAPLDPLPDFVVRRQARAVLRDGRNLAQGYLPTQAVPGGGEGEKEDESGLLNQVAVRKNFNPVPYYNPRLMIDPTGVATVHIKLPDSLTNFMLRAEVISGADRFGYGTGKISVRLPVIVEPALPRFVRPGDRFIAAATGRLVEGDGGPGRSEIKVEGLSLEGPATAEFTWDQTPRQIGVPVAVPSPTYGPDGRIARTSVTLTMGVERTADHARDAFQVTLPIQPDREPAHDRLIALLAQDRPVTLPAVADPLRPGTLDRTLTVALDPALLRLAAGLDYLRGYRFGNTEQRISKLRAEIAAQRFRDLLQFGRPNDQTARDFAATLAWLKGAIDEHGLVAFWPGGKGGVTLTAWTVQFLAEAKAATMPVDKDMMAQLTGSLQQSLRSDYAFTLVGEELAERAWALTALSEAGLPDPAYAAELSRRASMMTLESEAQVVSALAIGGPPSADRQTVLTGLGNDLWSGVAFKLQDGQTAYGGLQRDWRRTNPALLPSEARTLAEIIRGTAPLGADPRRKMLVDALVAAASPTGWGSTNANAEAFLALTDYLSGGLAGPDRMVSFGAAPAATLTVNGTRPVARATLLDAGAVQVTTPDAGPALGLLSDTAYVPAAPGSAVAAHSNGFAVTSSIGAVDGSQPLRLDQPGRQVSFAVGQIAEQRVEVVTSEDRHQVAITVPLAAGTEPLNPALATAPPEAKPSQEPTLAPSYASYLDDAVTFFYDDLPQGTYSFAFRVRATTAGTFTLPAAAAEMMYDESTNGNGNGAEIDVVRK